MGIHTAIHQNDPIFQLFVFLVFLDQKLIFRQDVFVLGENGVFSLQTPLQYAFGDFEPKKMTFSKFSFFRQNSHFKQHTPTKNNTKPNQTKPLHFPLPLLPPPPKMKKWPSRMYLVG